MPRGRPKKNQVEIDKAVAALGIARSESKTADEGVNKFIQAQAAQLLERVEADRAAKATDEPSGIEVGVDRDFLSQDPTKFTERLARKDIEVRKDHRYRWINRDPRRMERRVQMGWLPVAGGSVTNGDSALASMPQEMADAKQRQLAERKKLQTTAHIARLDAEGTKTGMEVFTGNKSLRDGLE